MSAQPYSPVRVVNYDQAIYFLSGQVGMLDGRLVEGGLEAEMRQAFRNVNAILEDYHLSFFHIVDVLVVITAPHDYERMNKIYSETFGDESKPARTCLVGPLPLGASFEIKVTAAK